MLWQGVAGKRKGAQVGMGEIMVALGCAFFSETQDNAVGHMKVWQKKKWG